LAGWGIATVTAVGANLLWTHRAPLIETRRPHSHHAGPEQLALTLDDPAG
jgi:hypothetical protein